MIQETENSLMEAVAVEGQPLAKKNLIDEMKRHSVPAVSIAVINNGAIEWAKAYGTLEATSARAASPSTLFQAGSVSKPIAAIGALYLVQKGLLDLDRPVNEQLRSWKIEENAHTASNKVTLRHLLSHTSGCNVIGFDGYESHTELPSLHQILKGERPANNPPISVQFTPGSKLAYSGGGYSLMQLLVEETAEMPFHHFMDDILFKKLQTTQSTFCYPLPQKYTDSTAIAHPGEGLPMACKWKTYPESAAAGLWTTPSDLATLVLQTETVIDQKLAQEMMRPQIKPWGLGPVVMNEDSDALEISHKGRTDGFTCGYVYFPRLKKGAAVMTNADNGAILLDQIFRSIAHVYQWPTYQVETRKTVLLPKSTLTRHVGRYGTESEPNDIYDLHISLQDNDLYLAIGKMEPRKIYPDAENRFFDLVTGYSIAFDVSKSVPTLTIIMQSGFDRTFRKF